MAMMTYMNRSMRRSSCFGTGKGKMENVSFMESEKIHSLRISRKDTNTMLDTNVDGSPLVS